LKVRQENIGGGGGVPFVILNQDRGRNLGGGGGGNTRNHRDNNDTILCEVTKSLHNNPRKYPLEKRGVESVCVTNKFLKVFIGNLGREGRALQILEEVIKTVGSEVNDYVALLGYIS
jgi:hypothetical protein